MDLISVIIPVYNVKEYLNKCIESVVNQTYKDLEIILIDDGSTDGSEIMCDNWQKKDPRIIIIHQENRGLSAARNSGIKRATGKYICFVDSDDFISNDYVEILYNNLIYNNVDISMCGFVDYYSESKMVSKIKKIKSKIYNKMDAQIYLNVLGYFDVASWNKLYKKELFDGLQFPEGKTCEDWHIMFKVLDKVDRIYYDSSVKYYYRKRENSITTSKNIRFDAIEAALSAIDFYKKNEYTKVLPYAYQSLMVSCLGIINHMIYSNNYFQLEKVMNIVNENRKFVSLKKIKFMKKIQLFIFMYFPNCYKRLFKFLKNNKVNI